MSTTTSIDRNRLAPCGYCRRCAIHDDPGGCLEVEAYERELVAAGLTVEEILGPDAPEWAVKSFNRIHNDERS